MSELPKTFDPAGIEARWYPHWEAAGAFRPHRPDAQPFTIVMPPPNVTGSLHVGHALDNTLPDILVRWNRMRGRDALWVPGLDHAGIATQMVVERNIASQGLDRRTMGREAFIEHVWEWKDQSGGAIVGQLRRLGASCDWPAQRFTMDEGLSRATIKVFVDLHRRGLIYRDKRLVNWDPALGTAISDLEVEPREVRGHFWHLRYPLEDGGHIEVATTRPETMLADMAVAVHPEDPRYRAMIGRRVRLPITGRRIAIIADAHADPELGSGAVKITPGHDFNDFEVGVRAGIKAADMLNMLDSGARVVQTADGLVPQAMLGLGRDAARAAVVAALEAEGALVRVEERTIQVPHGDRSGAVIEPWLTDQWYVDAKRLAGPALAAVANGRIEIVPDQWRKVWNQWLEGIQPWCVSRQLWWGHRIPAWYADDGRVFVAETEAEARAEAGCDLRRDEDVLDTWFSSALWPFATLGWPDRTEALARHYPGDVLISGFDILFFWDARMAMQGLEFMGDVPWRKLYLHGLVRDAQGRKMSKSKGNTIDPIGLIDRYGADALRFTLAAMESQGRDIKLDEARVAGYRNFATKLWNAARFAQASGAVHPGTGPAPAARHAINKWVIAGCYGMMAALDKALEELRFDAAADAVYQFAWARFCDWYLELAKPLLTDDATRDETRAVLGWALDRLLAALHPFMPFVTEELWHALGERETDLILAPWPAGGEMGDDGEVDWLIALVSAVRSARTGLNVAPSARLALHGDPEAVARATPHAGALARLARVESVTEAPVPPGGAAAIVVAGAAFRLALGGVVDLDAERARLEKGAAAARKEAASLAGRLSSAAFVERAKPEAVEKARADHAERVAEAERLEAALAGLA